MPQKPCLEVLFPFFFKMALEPVGAISRQSERYDERSSQPKDHGAK